MFDLLIVDGQIIDGTGNPGYHASIGIEKGQIHIIRGDTSSVCAEKVIDASNRVICPGFIDMHTHSALMILANPKHEPKVLQGCTTEVIGIDGMGYAPALSAEDLKKHMRLNSAADGAPELNQSWLSVDEYLSLFDRKVSCNVAYLIGNNIIRSYAIGWANKKASDEELKKMQHLITTGMEQGAYGISTGLDYTPGSFADTEEIIALCKEAKKLGGIYHTHVRYSLGDRFLDPHLEALKIGRLSGIAVHITHFQPTLPLRGGHDSLLGLIDTSRSQGLDVTFDCQPYIYNSGLLIITFPQWAKERGPDEFIDIIRSSEGRRRLEKEVVPHVASWHDWWLTNFQHKHNKRFEGKSVAEIVESTGKSFIDALCDLLIEEDLHICHVIAGLNGYTLPFFIQHPAYMVGSDSILLGDYPSPRTYGTFPFILGDMVREEKFLTLSEAIRKMTSAPAKRLGLSDRGILLDGFKADIVIFDPDKIKALATRHEPKQYPIGIDYVIVNGVIVANNGKHTGALPGIALRRGRD